MHKVAIVDDDADIVTIAAKALRAAGYAVVTAADGEAGLRLIRTERPSVVLLDLIMPKMHGFAVCQEIRKDSSLDHTRIIVVSAKTYGVDIAKTRELGADLHLAKPFSVEELLRAVNTMIGAQSEVWVKFWGTRGSIATPGPNTVRYGGNTACVEVRGGDTVLMLDCGTGAREMGAALAREFAGRPLQVHLFVSHTHWDHIQGFPFFAPAYLPGSVITIYSARGCDKRLDRIFTGQMDTTYFPVALSDLRAELHFVELDGVIDLGSIKVAHMYLNHPGIAVGFRIETAGKRIVYVTDHEVYSRMSGEAGHLRKLDDEVDQFASGADLYIREAQYTDAEYPGKKGWGHSTWTDALRSAQVAHAAQLGLYHHDPGRDDEALDSIVAECRGYIREQGMNLGCFAAADRQRMN